jgi:ribosome maturation factor RimP
MINVEITGDFDGDELTRGVMEEVAEQVRDHLGELRCPDHGEPPVVRLAADAEGEISVEVGGCCDALREQVTESLEDFE